MTIPSALSDLGAIAGIEGKMLGGKKSQDLFYFLFASASEVMIALPGNVALRRRF